jgi:hypothetical protein
MAMSLYFYLQEMVAALLIFSVMFVLLTSACLILLVLDVATQATLTWSKTLITTAGSRNLPRSAVHMSREDGYRNLR